LIFFNNNIFNNSVSEQSTDGCH